MLVCGTCGHIEERHIHSSFGSDEVGPCLACSCPKFNPNLQADIDLPDLKDGEVENAMAHLMKTARELGAA